MALATTIEMGGFSHHGEKWNRYDERGRNPDVARPLGSAASSGQFFVRRFPWLLLPMKKVPTSIVAFVPGTSMVVIPPTQGLR